MKIKEIEKLNTDELFKALPAFVNVGGDLYFFKLIKGNNRIIVEYKMNDSEGGKYLGSTYRGGKTLNSAMRSMLGWLIEFDYYDKVSENILLDMIKNIKKDE